MITARDLMTTNVITVKNDMPIKQIMKIMADHKIEALPVIDKNDYLVGIITDGDLMFRFSKFYPPLFEQILQDAIHVENPMAMRDEVNKMLGNTAGDIMTKRVVSVTEDMTLEDISSILVTRKVKRLPVVKDKKVIGIITRKDIISVLSKYGPPTGELK